MKKLVLIICALFVFISCDNEPEISAKSQPAATSQDSIENYKGNFISTGNAAVLKGDKFVYQVKMDSATIRLQDSLAGFKSEGASIIPIEVKGKVIENRAAGGYSKIIEIKEVVEIFAEEQEESNSKKN